MGVLQALQVVRGFIFGSICFSNAGVRVVLHGSVHSISSSTMRGEAIVLLISLYRDIFSQIQLQ